MGLVVIRLSIEQIPSGKVSQGKLQVVPQQSNLGLKEAEKEVIKLWKRMCSERMIFFCSYVTGPMKTTLNVAIVKLL